MSTLDDLVVAVLKVEAIRDRALTPAEAKIMAISRFLRAIAPYMFPPDDKAPAPPGRVC